MIENSILNVYPDFWLSNSSFGAYQYRIIRLARHDFQSETLSKTNSRVEKSMKTWFRRVRHLTRYVSSILKLISSIISASSRWKASRKKSQKGWDNFQKKISKIFKCLCFKTTILELISQDDHDGIPGFPDKVDAAEEFQKFSRRGN